jgi:integrase
VSPQPRRFISLPDVGFHGLRHTCATLLLTKGVHPKIVSELLGHSSIAITLDNYSHVIPGLGDAAVSAMEEVLF